MFNVKLSWGVLPLSWDAVDLFYSPSRLGFQMSVSQTIHWQITHTLRQKKKKNNIKWPTRVEIPLNKITNQSIKIVY